MSELEKPSKVEVGQRWDSPFSPPGSTLRVVDRVEAGRVYFDVGSWTTDQELLGDEKGYVYLGGPSPAPVRPAKPGLGQIWRHHDANGGANYELTGSEPWYNRAAWQIKRVDPVSGWTGNVTQAEVARSWTFVRYVDTPEPIAAPTEGTFSNELTSQPITAENIKRAADAIEALTKKTVFFPRPEWTYGVDWGARTNFYGLGISDMLESPKAPRKTASSVPAPVLPLCAWSVQTMPGSSATYPCHARVAHERSPYCEEHISQEMQRRDSEKPPQGASPKFFHQSHSLLAGGIWSLREQK